MGHCEPASGIAGLMKTIIALESATILPQQEVRTLNPNVDLNHGRLKIAQDCIAWPKSSVKRASVNSFGYGGANAHAIVDAYEHADPASTIESFDTKRKFLLPFSAHNEQTLKSNVQALRLCNRSWDFYDTAYTLGNRRSTFSVRSYHIAHTGESFSQLNPDNMTIAKVSSSQKANIGFVFTGQGAQWPRMGVDLMNEFPLFLQSIRNQDRILIALPNPPEWSIESSLKEVSDLSNVYKAEFSQPLVTAIQIALVDLLDDWGIHPTVVAGHSSGEIAAAYASGRLTAAEAIVIAYYRGVAVAQNNADGAMLAVGIGAEEITPLLENSRSVVIACHNSPRSVTLSGDVTEIMALKQSFDAKGLFARKLATGGNAYHSSHMNNVAEQYEKDLMSILPNLPKGNVLRSYKTFISSVTGREYTGTATARYWRRNLVSPVLFNQAIGSVAVSTETNLWVEIGPHSALQGPIRQILEHHGIWNSTDYIPTLLRNSNGADCLLNTVGKLFTRGLDVRMERVNSIQILDVKTNMIISARKGRTIPDLPSYQWQYGPLLYRENRWQREWRLRSHPRHDILGSRMPGGNLNAPMWRNILRHKDLPWLNDHKVGADIVFPTTAYLAMAVEAAMQIAELRGLEASQITAFELANVRIDNALIIEEDGPGTEVLFNIHSIRNNTSVPETPRWYFTITSVTRSGDTDVFTDHVTGEISYSSSDTGLSEPNNMPIQNDSLRPVSSGRWYDAFERVGLNYGPSFQNISNITVQGNSRLVQGNINMMPTSKMFTQESRYLVHPASLDAALQLTIVSAYRARFSECSHGFLPISIQKVVIHNRPPVTAALAIANTIDDGERELHGEINMQTTGGESVLFASQIRLIAAESVVENTIQSNNPFTKLVWKPDIEMMTEQHFQKLYPSSLSARDDTTLPLLDQLALHQFIQFHEENPNFFAEGSDVAHNQRFLNWMTEKIELCKVGAIPYGTDIISYTLEERKERIYTLEQELLQTESPQTRLMCHMYRSLPSIFRNEMAGIEAAIQDHHLDNMYAHMKMYHDGNSALAELVELLSHKNPNLKIIEIGGGTGSATRVILPALNGDTEFRGYESYTFTDVGPAFLAGAEESFNQYGGMIYRSFNMELDPEIQGFDTKYDLVIASNVLHASSNIKNTLENCRKLLNPGGRLAIFEYVEPKLSWNMILGTFSDFWLGDHDPHFPRTDGPFLTRKQWHSVLPISGFNGVDSIVDNFSTRGECAILMATANSVAESSSIQFGGEAVNVIVRDNASEFYKCIRSALEIQGVSVTAETLSTYQGACNRDLIFLVDTDQPLFTSIKALEWERIQQLLSSAKSAVWVTTGGLLHAKQPEFAMFSGMAGSIRSENPSLQLFTLDLDIESMTWEAACQNIIAVQSLTKSKIPSVDLDYLSISGILHVSRLDSHVQLNSIWSGKLQRKKTQFSNAVKKVMRHDSVLASDDGVENEDQRSLPDSSESDTDSIRSSNLSTPLSTPLVDNPAENDDTVLHYCADSEATYLLVGCLGGLGRSFVKWIVARGARDLIFLSRSGSQSAEVDRFLEELQLQHVSVKVVKGDVSRIEDVKRAIDSSTKPVKGVVQGALSLRVSYTYVLRFEVSDGSIGRILY
jgi:acyl transferase domain-containing protein